MEKIKKRKEERLKKKKQKRRIFILLLLIILTFFSCYWITKLYLKSKNEIPVTAKTESHNEEANVEKETSDNGETSKIDDAEKEPQKEPEKISITISAAGDCTLGSDINYISGQSFMNEYKKQQDYGYFFENVKEVFDNDDLTIVNLETTFTEATARANKKFRFKGNPEFTNIIKEGSIEAVNIANNHSHDYLQQGYDDTIKNLKNAGIDYFGYENKSIKDVNGVMVGMIGYEGWSYTQNLKDKIFNSINELKDNGAQLVIISFHWGVERKNYPNEAQKNLARYSIDAGADLVIGHHPHVIQGIEEYKGKNILYSLGNFCFGGNKNPSDKDTFIFQQTFNFEDGKLLVDNENKIIPCSISSVKNRNDYKPTISTGDEKNRILDRIKKYSNF
ncbi:CapA family protein [Clostridium sediminicola]|uniref:CapA family protein n=1 Tax=Clostridium sediminicola TaxID=3114879 RepID=UPI0031F27AB7